MKRRLFNLLAIASLVLCAATVALWVRSYWAADIFSRSAVSHGQVSVLSLWSQQGYSQLTQTSASGNNFEEGWQWTTDSIEVPAETWHWFSSQSLFNDDGGVTIQSTSICIPDWLTAVAFAAIPAWWLLGERRRRGALLAVGCCKKCGYDLRATPQRCPECGAIAADAPRGKIPA